MSKLWKLMGIGLIAGIAGASQAAPLLSSSLTITLQLPAIGLNSVIVFPGTATGNATSNIAATATGSNAFDGTTTTTPAGAVIDKIFVSVTNFQGLVYTGVTPVSASVMGFAALYPPNVASPLLSFYFTIGSVNMNFATGSGIALSLTGAPWVAKATTVTLGATNVTAMTTGVNGLNATGFGTLTLVSPGKVLTNLGAAPQVALFGKLTLNYVPEPGTLLLLGSGALGLAVLGRRRAT